MRCHFNMYFHSKKEEEKMHYGPDLLLNFWICLHSKRICLLQTQNVCLKPEAVFVGDLNTLWLGLQAKSRSVFILAMGVWGVFVVVSFVPDI